MPSPATGAPATATTGARSSVRVPAHGPNDTAAVPGAEAEAQAAERSRAWTGTVDAAAMVATHQVWMRSVDRRQLPTSSTWYAVRARGGFASSDP